MLSGAIKLKLHSEVTIRDLTTLTLRVT